MDPQKLEAKLKALGVKRKRARKNKYAVYMPRVTRDIIWKPQPCRGRKHPGECAVSQFHQWGVNTQRWHSRCFTCKKSY